MDQELIAYLDERFRESSRQIEGFRDETLQRFERVDARFEKVDARFEGIDARFERLEDEVHKTRILVEKMEDTIGVVAEGVLGMGQRMDSFQNAIRHEIEGHNKRLILLEAYVANEGRDKIEVIRERYGPKL